MKHKSCVHTTEDAKICIKQNLFLKGVFVQQKTQKYVLNKFVFMIKCRDLCKMRMIISRKLPLCWFCPRITHHKINHSVLNPRLYLRNVHCNQNTNKSLDNRGQDKRTEPENIFFNLTEFAITLKIRRN